MDRYNIQQDGDTVICADVEIGIVVTFTIHQFNETQVVKFFKDVEPDAMKLARYMREMADYLRANHYDLVF